jgi:hypothetical protein
MLPGQAEVVLTEMRLLHHGVISVRGVLLIEDS